MCGARRFISQYLVLFCFFFIKICSQKNKLRTNWGWNRKKIENNRPRQNLLVHIKKAYTQGLGRTERPMGQWPMSLKINGPILKFTGHYQNSMCQKLLFNHTDSRHLLKINLSHDALHVDGIYTKDGARPGTDTESQRANIRSCSISPDW